MQTPQPNGYFTFMGSKEQSLVLPYVDLGAGGSSYSFATWLRVDAATTPDASQGGCTLLQLISNKGSIETQIKRTDVPRVYKLEVSCGSREVSKSVALQLGCWHHLALRHTSRRLRSSQLDLWLNSVPLLQDRDLSIPSGTISSAKFGLNLVGAMCGVTLYSGLLEPEHVAALYASGPSHSTAWHSLSVPLPMYANPDVRHAAAASASTGVAVAAEVAAGARLPPPPVAALLLPAAGDSHFGGRHCGVWASSGVLGAAAHMSAPAYSAALTENQAGQITRGLASTFRQGILGQGVQAIVPSGVNPATDPMAAPKRPLPPNLPKAAASCILGLHKLGSMLADTPQVLHAWVALCGHTATQLCISSSFREEFQQLLGPACVASGIQTAVVAAGTSGGENPVTPPVAAGLLHLFLTCRCSKALARAGMQHILFNTRVWTSAPCGLQLVWLRAVCTIVAALGADCLKTHRQAAGQQTMDATTVLSCMRQSMGSDDAHDAWLAAGEDAAAEATALWSWLLGQALLAMLPSSVQSVSLHLQDTFQVNDTKRRVFSGAEAEGSVSGVGVRSTDSGRVGGVAAFMRNIASSVSRQDSSKFAQDAAAFASRRSTGAVGSPLPLLLAQLASQASSKPPAHTRLAPKDALGMVHAASSVLTADGAKASLHSVVRAMSSVLQGLSTAASNMQSEALLRTLLWLLSHPVFHTVFFRSIDSIKGASTALVACMEPCAQAAWSSAVAATAPSAETAQDTADEPPEQQRVVLLGLAVLAALLGHREATAVGSSVLGQITTNGSVPINASTEESLAVVSPEMQRSFRSAFPSITAARAYLTLSSALRTVCIMVPLQTPPAPGFKGNTTSTSARQLSAAAAAASTSTSSGFGGASAVGSQGDGRSGRHTGQLSLLTTAAEGVGSLGHGGGAGEDDAASLPSPSRLRSSSKALRTPRLSFLPAGRPATGAHTVAGSPRRGRRSSNISFMRSPAVDRLRSSTLGSRPSPVSAPSSPSAGIARMESNTSATSGGADDWEVLDGEGASKATAGVRGSDVPPSVLTGASEEMEGITLSFAEDGVDDIRRSRSGSVLSEFGRSSVHLRVGSLGSSSVVVRPKQHAGDGVDVELGAPEEARDSQLRRPRRTHSSTQILAAVLRILVPDAAVEAVNGSLSVLGAGSIIDGVDASKAAFPASPHLLCAIQHLLTPSLLKTLSLGRRINDASSTSSGSAQDDTPFSPSAGHAGGGARAATIALAAALSEDTLHQLRLLDNSEQLLLWVAMENLAGFMQQAGALDSAAAATDSHVSSMQVLNGLAHAVPTSPMQCAAAINAQVLSLQATQAEQHVSLMVLPSAAVLLMACVRAAGAQVVSAAKHINTKSSSKKTDDRCARLCSIVDRMVFAPLMWVHSLLKFGDQVSADTARGNARLWLTLRGWQHQLLAMVQPPALAGCPTPDVPPLPASVKTALESASTVALRVFTTLALVALRFEGGATMWTDTWSQCLALHAHRSHDERHNLALATFAAAAQAVLVAINRDKGALSSRTGSADVLASNVHALLAVFTVPSMQPVSIAVAPDMLGLLPSLHGCKLPPTNKVLWRELKFLHTIAHKASTSDDERLVSACVPAICESVQNSVHARLPDLARFSSKGTSGHYTAPKVQYTLPGGNGGVLGVDGETSHVEVLLFLLGCLRPLLQLSPSITKGEQHFDLQELAGSMVMAVFNSCRFGPLEVQIAPWRDDSLGAGASPEAILPRHRPAGRVDPTKGPQASHATKAERAADALSCIDTALSAVVERATAGAVQAQAGAASEAGAAAAQSPDEEFAQLPDARVSLNPLIIESAAWDVHARTLSTAPMLPVREEETSPIAAMAPDGSNVPAHVWGMYRLGMGISLAASSSGHEEVLQARFRAIGAFLGGLRKSVNRQLMPLQRELLAPAATLGGLAVTDVPQQAAQVQYVDASAALQSLARAPTAGWKLDSHDATSALLMPFGGWGTRTRLVQAADTALTAQSYKDYSIASNSGARADLAQRDTAAAAGDMEQQGAELAAQLAAAGAVTDIAAEQQADSAAAAQDDGASEAGSEARSRGLSSATGNSAPDADDDASIADNAAQLAQHEEAEEAAMDAAMEVSEVAQLSSSAELVVRARLLNAKGPTRGTLFLMKGRYVWRPEVPNDASSEWVDVPSIVREEGEDSDDDVQPSTQLAMQRAGWSPKRTQQLAWNAKDVCGVWMRTYCLQSTALELEVARFAGPRRRRYFFTFVRKDVRDNVANRLIETLGGQPRAAPRHSLAHRVPFSPPHAKAGDVLLASGLPQAWSQGELSNMEYLLALNSMAGRSMHDTNQYPVFPWVLADYDSDELDLAHPGSFRDLRRPMGALTRARLLEFRSRFESLGGGEVTDANDAPAGILPFMYGSHYSTSVGTVMHYLLRLFPFTAGHALTQEGHFDVADRLFASVPEAWRLATQSLTEVKELTPEWYSTPAFLLNLSQYNFGETQDGDPVSDVRLPKWVDSYTYPYVSLVPKSAQGSVRLPPQAQAEGRSPMARARAFIAAQREALESPFVTARLHNWIDLVFGQKQRGPAAVEADNVFYYCTYEGAVNVEAVKDSTIRKALKLQILHYGQTPTQLLSSPHPNRSVKAASASRPHSIADDLRAARSVVDFAASASPMGADVSPPATPSAADGSALSMLVTFHHAAIHHSATGGYSLWRPVFALGQSAGDMGDEGSKVAFSLGDAISLGGVPPPATLMLSASADTVSDLVLSVSEDGLAPDGTGAGKDAGTGDNPPPPLAYPQRFNLQLQLTSDSENHVCIWSAVPPPGYVALGCIASLVAAGVEGELAEGAAGAAEAGSSVPASPGAVQPGQLQQSAQQKDAADRLVSPTPKTGSGVDALLQAAAAPGSNGLVPPPLDAMVCVHASLVLDAKLSQRVHVPLSSIQVSVDVPADVVEEEEILRIDPTGAQAAPSEDTPSADAAVPEQQFRRISQRHFNAIWAVHSPANAFVVPDLDSLMKGRTQRSARAGHAADGSLQWHGEALNEVADDREWQSYLAADAMAFTLNPARLGADSSMARRLPGWDTGMAGPWGYASQAIDTEDDIVALCALDEANGRVLAVSSCGSLHVLRVAAQRLELPQPPAPVASTSTSDPGVTTIVAERIANVRSHVAGAVSAVGEAVSYALGEPGADGGTFTGWLVRDETGKARSLYSMVNHVGLVLQLETRTMELLQDMTGINLGSMPPPVTMHVPLAGQMAARRRASAALDQAPHTAPSDVGAAEAAIFGIGEHLQLSPVALTPSGRVAVVGAGPGAGAHLTALRSDRVSGIMLDASLTLPPTSQTASITAVAVAPDGDWVALGHDDGSTQLWPVAHLHAGWGRLIGASARAPLSQPMASKRPLHVLQGGQFACAGDSKLADDEAAWAEKAAKHCGAAASTEAAAPEAELPVVTAIALSASEDCVLVGHVGEAWLYELARGRPLRRFTWTPTGAAAQAVTHSTVACIGAHFVAGGGVLLIWSGKVTGPSGQQTVSCVMRHEVGAFAEAPTAMWMLPTVAGSDELPLITASAALDARAPQGGYSGSTSFGGVWGPKQAQSFDAAVKSGNTRRAFGHRGPRELVAVGDTAGRVTVLDALDCAPLVHFVSQAQPVRSITASPCGGYIISAGGGGAVRAHALPALSCVAGSSGTVFVDNLSEHLYSGADRVKTAAMSSVTSAQDALQSGKGLAEEVGSLVKGVWGNWFGGKKK